MTVCVYVNIGCKTTPYPSIFDILFIVCYLIMIRNCYANIRCTSYIYMSMSTYTCITKFLA